VIGLEKRFELRFKSLIPLLRDEVRASGRSICNVLETRAPFELEIKL
jgi:hypothetical protein